MSDDLVPLTLAEVSGVSSTKQRRRHAEALIPGGVVVDRALAQIVGMLRAAGIQTVECCEDGWATSMAYIIFDPSADVDRACKLLGHSPSAATLSAIEDCAHRGMQVYGPWFRSHDGWALGAVWESGPIGWPAVAWPSSQIRAVTDHIAAATGQAQIKLKRVQTREQMRRGTSLRCLTRRRI
jgi:hypothetical protein